MTLTTSDTDRLEVLQKIIEHEAHLLPAQGPITVFVHHNTLHAFEDLPFDEAVKQGAKTFGCHPYLPEDRYRQKLANERIRISDLQAILQEDLGELANENISGLCTRLELRLAMLEYPLQLASSTELRWLVAETDALRRFRERSPAPIRQRMIDETRRWIMRDLSVGLTENNGTDSKDQQIKEALKGLFEKFNKATIDQWSETTWESFCLHLLWRVCYHGLENIPPASKPTPLSFRHRDLLLQATGEDSDRLVHDVLIRFCSAFLDQGLSAWNLPQREEGFYRSFISLYQQSFSSPDRWMRGLKQELDRLEKGEIGPLESVEESLRMLGVPRTEEKEFISNTLLALRGWAGMIWQIEQRGDRAVYPSPSGSLVEFMAIRLILDRLALTYVAKQTLDFNDPLKDLREFVQANQPKDVEINVERRAMVVFQLSQVLGWKPEVLDRLTDQQWLTLVEEIRTFSSLERRRVYHMAFERRYRNQTLDAIAIHTKNTTQETTERSFQIVCCIDEREESFRRHLEEIQPAVETFGVAGFFSIAMYYRGAADAHYVPLCPVVIKPQHYVTENVVYTFEEMHRRRSQARRVIGSASHRFHLGSRTFIGGAITGLLGSLASFPLVARILFPRLTAQIRQLFGRLVKTPPMTQLQLERTSPTPGSKEEQIGYSVDEMANIVEQLLRDMGLTSKFARLIVIIGHGSSSLNNPHEAAHDCGACGGGRGGPNARAFAQMANDPRVRELISHKGLFIPRDVVFVGAYHNTCNDNMTYYDLERLPNSHRKDLEQAEQALYLTRERNAHERCRRFQSAPLTLSREAALRHVEGRAEDLSQTRPEYGHASNALCIVGRRSRTRGLFLDRRAFLTSYDPTQDDEEHSILTRILQAVVPVCGGINLEYYFSYVDPTGWGCGTKLPHNISSLLGVMDGAASDLRPGLPWQMVEIHEPVRLLFVIETTPEAMLKVMDRNEGIANMCRNSWVQLATLDSESSEIHVFRNNQFELYHQETNDLPKVKTSLNWYRGWRDHLGFASIENGNEAQTIVGSQK